MKIECIMNNDHYHKINIKKSDLFPLFWSLHNDLHGIDHGIKTSGAENKTVPQYFINIHVNHDFHILTWPWQVMKDSMIRSFSWFEPDILKQSSRPEWPVMLHNLCFLHAAIQLRARFGQGGWNCPQDFFNIGYSCLQVWH